MNIGPLIAMLKLFGDAGLTKPSARPPTPPTSEAGKRPDCGAGKKAIINDFDQWVCVPDLK